MEYILVLLNVDIERQSWFWVDLSDLTRQVYPVSLCVVGQDRALAWV